MQQNVTRGLPAGDHTDSGCPPLGTDSTGENRNRAIKSLVHSGTDNLGPPRIRSKDLVESLRMRRTSLGPLLDQHVQFAPHHIDEQLDATGPHQIGKQISGNLETVWVDEQERRCHSSALAAEVAKDGRELLECIALACVDVHARRKRPHSRKLLLERSEVRRVTFDEQEIELRRLKQSVAIRMAKKGLERDNWRTGIPAVVTTATRVSIDVQHATSPRSELRVPAVQVAADQIVFDVLKWSVLLPVRGVRIRSFGHDRRLRC